MCVRVEIDEKEKRKNIKNCIWKQFAVFLSWMFFLFVFYYLANSHINHLKEWRDMVQDDFSLMFQIDEIKEEKNVFILEGWAFKLGTDAKHGDIEIMLHDMDSKKIIYSQSTEYVSREDVNKYFLCEYDYRECGMIVKFRTNKFDIPYKNYEVLIKNVETERVYQTGTFIVNGKLSYCAPNSYKDLQVQGTGLENIVKEGILRSYLADAGIYFYQKEGKFYFITEKEFEFAKNGATHFGYLLGTTQVDNLPQWRLDNNRTNDARDFVFENMELDITNDSGYRVAVTEIPDTYAITNVVVNCIGEENEIKWSIRIRPWFEFEE